MITTIDSREFDVREIPCRIKHGQIIQKWLELPVGDYFVLVNDHEPVPLYYQFEATFKGEFTWEKAGTSEDCFKIRIGRIAAAKGATPAVPQACATPQATTGELDVRGMEPPGPMVEILKAVEQLSSGATLRARTDRRPLHLFAELDTRGIRYNSESLADGSWLTTLNRA
jgi:uncharacterized protein (DUF2249 family)